MIETTSPQFARARKHGTQMAHWGKRGGASINGERVQSASRPSALLVFDTGSVAPRLADFFLPRRSRNGYRHLQMEYRSNGRVEVGKQVFTYFICPTLLNCLDFVSGKELLLTARPTLRSREKVWP